MGSTRRATALATVAGAIGLVFGATFAWACVPAGSPGSLQATPGRAKPGQQVQLTGAAGGTTPVAIYLTPADGPPIAQIPVTPDGEGYAFNAAVTLPASAPVGYTVLIAVQDGIRWQLPFTVLGPGDDPAAVEAGPAGAAKSTGSGRAGPVIVGAVVVLVALGGIGLLSMRRRRRGADVKTGEEQQPPVPVG